MYTNETVYSRFGKHFCLMYDVAVAKGGTEAIVESVYSVMDSQKQSGRQSNETLVNRSIVDWHCPKTPIGIPDFIDEATVLYNTNHSNPFTRCIHESKVIKRMGMDTGRLPPA